jgi:NAD(P)-dependent dehydrogenase (short-subunit alcohol dehydrogenase family)
MRQRFTGKGILVTGAASGIGLAAARGFAAEGGCVLLADINGEAAEAAAAALRAAGATAIATMLDVADYAQCEAAVALCVEAYGALDIAFNNAGMPSRISAEFEDFALEEWRRLIDVNLGGAFYCMKAEAPALKAAGGGAIVNTASVASLVAAPGMAAYVASKHGLAGLTKAAAVDLIRHRIRVNAVCPGMINTAMLAPLVADQQLLRHMESQTPIGRVGEADEVARAVLFLASDEASYMVGTLLSVDGGVILQ